MQIVLASKNPDKFREFKELSSEDSWLELIPAPEDLDVEETGSTFIENAIIKAQAAAVLTGQFAIADDSGLTVDALGGKPGINSARYCEGSDADRRAKLLKEMTNIPEAQRSAAYVCAMALVDVAGNVLHKVQEPWPGAIAFAEAGSNGFGYDPIFVVAGVDVTAAQLSPHAKNQVSHRAKAWRRMLEYLKERKSHLVFT